MGLGLCAEKAPIACCVEFWSLLVKAMSELVSLPRVVAQLDAIGIADHVVMEADAAHPSAWNRKGLQQAAAAAFKPLGSDDDLFANRGAADVDEAAVVPVAVREQNARDFAGLVLRPIEIAGDKEAGH